MEAGKVRLGSGISLAYDIAGSPDAPVVVLLHALGEQRSSWAPVMDRFTESFRVIAVDLRGHGDSDRPGEYSFQLMRDDVLGFLDELGLPTATLVGHSMGGGAAYLVAMSEPGRVERLVVEDAAPPYPRDRRIPERPDGPLDFDWAVVPAIVGQVNAGDPEAWAGLPAITAPTLLIGGGPESHIRQEKLAEAAVLIPRCEVVTIPAGHYVHNGRPAEFADAVLTWMAA
jgi:pimeloyl-ACP methyl ester carboxylesterase